MTSVRVLAKTVLSEFIKKDKMINSIEKSIYDISRDDENKYRDILFEVAVDLKRNISPEQLLQNIKSGTIMWNHVNFNEIIFRQKEQDDFIVTPFEVAEGVLKCPKCSHMKTFSFSKQTRSADEPMTTFSQCVKCKHKWTYSG